MNQIGANRVAPSDLRAATAKMALELLKHCKEGPQTKDAFPNGDGMACGQYYGKLASDHSLTQRGLFGSASAIAVLALSSSTEAQAAVKGLAHYVVSKPTVDKAIHAPKSKHVEDDGLSTIKNAELYEATRLAGLPQADTYFAKLKAGQCADGGWAHFLDKTAKADRSVIATAYVLMCVKNDMAADALMQARKYLFDELKGEKNGVRALDDAHASLALLALVRTRHGQAEIIDNELQEVADRLWAHRMFSKTDVPREVTVAFARESRNHYVRLTWEVYLIRALIALKPGEFYSQKCQWFFANVKAECEKEGGYVFLEAGPYFATRSNAAIYFLFDEAQKINIDRPWWIGTRDFLSNWWARFWVRGLTATVVFFAVLIASEQLKGKLAGQTGIFTELVGNLVNVGLGLILISGRKQR